jgi:hypothetical protein
MGGMVMVHAGHESGEVLQEVLGLWWLDSGFVAWRLVYNGAYIQQPRGVRMLCERSCER